MPEQKPTQSRHLSNFVGGAYVATRDGASATIIDPSPGADYLMAPVSGKDLSSYGLEDYTRVKHVMSSIGS
jgi:hypothetical protein